MDEILQDGFAALGLSFGPAAAAAFRGYYGLLESRSAVTNLTAIRGEADTARLHFLDSCALLRAADFAGKRVIDVGTGAGFPGLPLKIARPDIRLTLLDSLGKRVDFLREVCAALGLNDVACVAARAEEAPPELRERFDIAVSRAVARLAVLCELCLPFVAVGGVFIAMKGPDCAEEAAEAGAAASALGGGEIRLLPYEIPGADVGRTAVLIRKTAPTPAQYPRRWAKISRRPL